MDSPIPVTPPKTGPRFPQIPRRVRPTPQIQFQIHRRVPLKIGPSKIIDSVSHSSGTAVTTFRYTPGYDFAEVLEVTISDPRCKVCGAFIYDEKFYPIFLAHEDIHVALAELGEISASLSYDAVDGGVDATHNCKKGTRITKLRGLLD